MTTVADITNRALEICGILAAGEAASADDTGLCVRALSSMLDQWQLDPQATLGLRVLTPFTPSAGAQSVTIGALGQIVTPMPVSLDLSSFYRVNGVDVPMPQADTFQEYAAQASKAVQGTPGLVYYERGNDAIGRLYLWPASDGTYQLNLYAPQQNVSGFDTIDATTTLTLANGYRKALEDCLAADLATSFDVPAVKAAYLSMQAGKSQRKLKRGNFRSYQIQPQLRRRYDIRTE